MPIYVYQIITPTGEGATFEVMQRLDEPTLTHLPYSGEPVRRIISAPNLPLKHGTSAQKSKLNPANLAQNGFTRYEKEGTGRYVKTAGDAQAPSVIKPS